MTKNHEAAEQGHACACRGPRGGKQHSASEAESDGEGRVAGTALDILDERFARGEIEKAEYEEKKQLISQRAAPPKVDVPDCDQSQAAAKTKPESPKRHMQRR